VISCHQLSPITTNTVRTATAATHQDDDLHPVHQARLLQRPQQHRLVTGWLRGGCSVNGGSQWAHAAMLLVAIAATFGRRQRAASAGSDDVCDPRRRCGGDGRIRDHRHAPRGWSGELLAACSTGGLLLGADCSTHGPTRSVTSNTVQDWEYGSAATHGRACTSAFSPPKSSRCSLAA